eukprot:GEZU01014636.1.p1 GENE.GEZU01014636.1~~GEZU01014636.1.p1  ORF type:complete len:227 (-),score=58.79 GEZU01014636.1:16-696(-)
MQRVWDDLLFKTKTITNHEQHAEIEATAASIICFLVRHRDRFQELPESEEFASRLIDDIIQNHFYLYPDVLTAFRSAQGDSSAEVDDKPLRLYRTNVIVSFDQNSSAIRAPRSVKRQYEVFASSPEEAEVLAVHFEQNIFNSSNKAMYGVRPALDVISLDDLGYNMPYAEEEVDTDATFTAQAPEQIDLPTYMLDRSLNLSPMACISKGIRRMSLLSQMTTQLTGA